MHTDVEKSIVVKSQLLEYQMPKLEKMIPGENVLLEVLLYMQKNWKFKAETSEYYLLTKLDVTLTGHIVIATLFGWWLFFIPNLLYHFMMKKKKKIFKYSQVTSK